MATFKIKDLTKELAKSLEEARKIKDKECSEGRHGFTTESWAQGGWIYTRCRHCGATWRTEDISLS